MIHSGDKLKYQTRRFMRGEITSWKEYGYHYQRIVASGGTIGQNCMEAYGH